MANNNINKKFSKYKLKKKDETMKELCLPRNFSLQPQQKFIREFFSSRYSNNGILIYHKIGAGKTCTAVAIAEKLKNKMKIMVVVPAALIGNFRDELRSKCADDEYITDSKRELLSKLTPKNKLFKKILLDSDKKINEKYTIYSYHKFIELCEKKKIKLKNTLLIIDEVQNMVSESGNFYKNLKNIIDKSDKKTKIVLLSATPMFDKPVELALTLNLLKLKKEIEIGTDFNNKYLKKIRQKNIINYEIENKEELQKAIKGYISYYRGANPKAFPKQIFKTVNCKMESFQYKSYLTSLSTEEYMKGSFRDADILDLPNNFLLGPRIISNIAYPNKGIGAKGYLSFKGNSLKTKNIKNYSKKIYKIYNKIKSSSGPIFIYSNFKDYGGIKSMVTFLEYHGYKNYKVNGEGPKRYAVWSGDERTSTKEGIKFTFNQKNNYDGSKIKILLGTPSIKEGVSLLRVEQVHILEPYWNMSRLLQIIGRAIRFCSHKDLPSNRRQVEVFLYLSTYPGIQSVDQKIWQMAKRKHILIQQFELAMKEVAIDCNLFYHRNVYKGDKPIKCLK
jgi:superfamily II DNA or RNA helicase